MNEHIVTTHHVAGSRLAWVAIQSDGRPMAVIEFGHGDRWYLDRAELDRMCREWLAYRTPGTTDRRDVHISLIEGDEAGQRGRTLWAGSIPTPGMAMVALPAHPDRRPNALHATTLKIVVESGFPAFSGTPGAFHDVFTTLNDLARSLGQLDSYSLGDAELTEDQARNLLVLAAWVAAGAASHLGLVLGDDGSPLC